MATEFICQVGPEQTDYTLPADWESQHEVALNAATVKVFGGTRTGVIADSASVEGANSGATGTVVHCTATQILIEAISGTFQSAEAIEVDESNYFTTSDAGDSAIAVALCATTGDASGALTVSGATVSDTNYRVVRAASGQEATQPFSTTRFRFGITGATNGLTIGEAYFRIEKTQVDFAPSTGSKAAIYGTYAALQIDRCVIRQSNSATGSAGIYINDTDGTGFAIRNTIVYNFTGYGICVLCNSSGLDLLNITAYGCGSYGIYVSYGDCDKCINNLSYDNVSDDFNSDLRTGAGTFTYNFSKDDSAGTGTGCIRGDTDGKYPQFIDVTSTDIADWDLHIDSDSDAIGVGLGYGSDSDIPTEDFEGDDRGTGSTCDIGADEYEAGGPTEYPLSGPDGVEISDTPSAEGVFGGSVGDGAELSDALSAEAVFGGAVADGIELSDAASYTITIPLTIADGVEVSDAVSTLATFEETIADGVELGDGNSILGSLGVTVADGIELSDSASALATFADSVADGVEFSDAVSTEFDTGALPINCTDGTTFSDSVSAATVLEGLASEGVEAADTPGVEAILNATTADGVEVGDTVSTTVGEKDITAVDGVEFSDAASALAEFLAEVADGVTYSDAVSCEIVAANTVADGVELADAPSCTIVATITHADGMEAADGCATTSGKEISVADGISLGDAAGAIAEFVATVVDGLLASDASSIQATFQVAVPDGVTLSDVVTEFLAIYPSVADGLALSDTSGTVIVVAVGKVTVEFTISVPTITFTHHGVT